MITTIPSILYEPAIGVIDNVVGYTDTLTMLMMNVLTIKASGKSWQIRHYRVRSVSTSDQVTAFSLNNNTGLLYMNDQIVCTWDPTLWGCIWAFDATKPLYTVAQSTIYWYAFNKWTNSSITQYISGGVFQDINPDRTAISAMNNEYGRSLLLGHYGK